MTRPRTTIAQLMAIVFYLGIGFAALRNADDFWASATYTLSIFVISAALLGALIRKGTRRPTWIGFAVFGWAYLVVGRLPGFYTPFDGSLNAPSLLIEWGAKQLQPYIYPPGAATNFSAYLQVSHSLGIILFGLVGAIVAHFIAATDE